MNSNNWVVFDLDGTLNRTDLVTVEAHWQVQREFGLPRASRELILSTFGAKSTEYIPLLAGGLDAEGQTAYNARLIELEHENLTRFGCFYDGADSMLRTLRAAGYRTAVCSNSSTRYITNVLKTIGLWELIDDIEPIQKHLTKEDTLGLLLARVHAAKSVMVGDRIFDKEAALANRIPFIGCLYGFSPDEVREADAVVSTVSEIPAAVARLIG